MPRPKKPVPAYRLHRQSGQAIVTLTDCSGTRRDVLLGKYDSPESRAEYARVIVEWETSGRRLPTKSATNSGPADITVNELAAAYLRHAEEHYRRADGTPTQEVAEYKMAIRVLVHLYGHTPVKDFGPLAMKAVRRLMIDGYGHPKHGTQPGLSRGVVNQRVGRIRRVFKWGVGEELVPASVLAALQAVRGLQRGRSDARETEPVAPVAVAHVEAVLPHVMPPVRAMILLQLHSGMRPGEVRLMRACDLDMSGPVWLYRPLHHKTTHRGKARVIALGPKCQAIIREHLKLDTQAYLFTPADALAAKWAEDRRKRKTKVYASQKDRRSKNPQLRRADHYTATVYDVAIRRGCGKADAQAREKAIEVGMSEAEAKATVFVPSWHPHQLRHTHATEVRRRFGLEAAQACLGHDKADITQLYAERDIGLAVRVAQQIG